LIFWTWKAAVRAWLETAIPPVFGKEMKNGQRADISNTGIGFFVI
jgi:hypothetical protein